MKMWNGKKVKTILLTCLTLFATAVCSLAVAVSSPVKGNAETLSSTVYQTDGASVRVFKITRDEAGQNVFNETDKKGIRFHVETGANYQIANGTPLLNTAETNANGSYKMAEGYKSYTLVLPTRLMGGSFDLTMDLEKVMKIDTTEYWFTDKDGNWESVAYIYNIPEKWYTDEFTYRGIIVSVDENGNETPVKWTSLETRIFSWVAKRAYNDTLDEGSNYWGSEENDKTAAPLIKKFIPTYTINYINGGTEEVLWGDTLKQAASNKTYYDETNHEPIDITKPLEMSTSCTIELNETQVSDFVFTGVEYTTEGFNVFATLPTSAFGHDVVLEPSAVDMVTSAGNVVKATSVKVHVEGTDADAVSELQIGFSYENITNGTKLTILDTSHFYNDGILYHLAKDYQFEYYNNTWELPLGQITLADIKEIKNYSETGANGVEHNVRITFNRDFLVNGGVTFKTADGTPSAITITCPENNNEVKKTINDGYYYWNQGEEKILELPGENGGDFWGEHENDIMTIAAGTRVYQNNGYYLVSEAITATFNGKEDWLFAPNYHDPIDVNEFTSAYTRQEGDSIYIDVKTKTKWATSAVEVVCNDGIITYNHSDNVTKCEIKKVVYHGEGNNQILRLYIDEFSITGDWVTIPEGTNFWVGNDVFTLSEDIISYFVDTKQWNANTQQWDNKGSTWITNPTVKDITADNFTSIGWYNNNIRFTTNEVWSQKANNKVIMDDTYIEGDGVIATGTNYDGFYYYGGTNSLLEMQGVNFDQSGGSVTLKAGTYFWLFDNSNFSCQGAYHLTEDIVVEISGATGSQIYKDVEVATVTKSDIASLVNDGSHGGEIRIFLKGTLIQKMYGSAVVEGSATLNGAATTSAWVYGGDGTSGYTGNTIIAFTGTDFGKAFQATAKGDVVKIAAGTKVWLSNGEGYVTFADELIYVYRAENDYVAQTEHTVTFNSVAEVPVKVNGEALTSVTAKTGEKVTFTVTLPTGWQLASVVNATQVSVEGNVYTYTTDYLFGNVTVTVNCSEPISIDTSSFENLIAYYNADNATDFEGFRLQLKATDAINAVQEKYNGTFAGTIEMKVGETTAPTAFHYYGGANRMIAIGCDISGMQAGDYMTIKAGSTFVYGASIFLVESDIKIVTVTANFDANIGGFSFKDNNSALDAEALTSGQPKAVFAGTQATFTFGWAINADTMYTLEAVNFNGADKGAIGTYNVTIDECTTIEVVTKAKPQYTVTATMEGNATLDVTSKTVMVGGSVTFTVTVPGNAKIQVDNEDVYTNTSANAATYNHTVSNVTGNTTVAFATLYQVTISQSGATVSGVTNNGWYKYGTVIKPTVSYSYDSNRSFKINNTNHTSGAEYTITGKTEISASSSGGCLVEGTLITLADGTTKAVENLKAGDMLLVFNHETGKYDTAPLLVNTHAEAKATMYTVISLYFSNGEVLKISDEHALFSKTENKYVYINEANAYEFIGDEFVSSVYENGVVVSKSVTLDNVTITNEVTRIFTPVSAWHMNLIAANMLTLSGRTTNFFEYDETMKYDEEKMQADIEQYGLYTYEDFAEYVSEEVFNAFPFKYFKVAIEKGEYTWEELMFLISEYNESDSEK